MEIGVLRKDWRTIKEGTEVWEGRRVGELVVVLRLVTKRLQLTCTHIVSFLYYVTLSSFCVPSEIDHVS